MVRREKGLYVTEQIVPPRAQVNPVLCVQRLRTIASYQIPADVQLAVSFPVEIRGRQPGNAEPKPDSLEHIVEVALLVRAQRPGQQFMRSLGVVEEHVEHIAVGPIRNDLAALAFDGLMHRADPVERVPGGERVRKNDLLSVARGCEEPPDGIAGEFPREEQPVDGAIERELGGTTSEDEEQHIPVSPDFPDDGIPGYEVVRHPMANGRILNIECFMRR